MTNRNTQTGLRVWLQARVPRTVPGSNLESADTLRVFADASVKANMTGLGLVIKNDRGAVTAWRGRRAGPMSCNEAEYAAVIFALEHALEAEASCSARSVVVHSDSRLVVEQMQGAIGVNSEALRPLHARAKALARRFSAIRFVHIPRGQNELADAMAEEACHDSFASQ